MTRIKSEATKERDRRSSREAKRKRRGTCLICGAETRYNGHEVAVSELCSVCGRVQSGLTKRGRGKNQEALRSFLQDGPKRYAEITRHLGVKSQQTSVVIHRAMKYGHIRRVAHGTYELVPENEGAATS